MIHSDPHNLLPEEDEIRTEQSEPPPSRSSQQTQKPEQTERTGRAWPSVSTIISLGSDLDPLGKL
jgi:hypothetical protein